MEAEMLAQVAKTKQSGFEAGSIPGNGGFDSNSFDPQKMVGNLNDPQRLTPDQLIRMESLQNVINADPASSAGLSQKAYETVTKVRTRINELYTEASDILKRPSLSSGDMIQLQAITTEIYTLIDLSSKMGDKASQAFQTLFRNQ